MVELFVAAGGFQLECAYPGSHMLVPFKYVDFYDVPRIILFRYDDNLFLLASFFDDEQDDYDSEYTLYLLPAGIEQRIEQSSWAVLEEEIGAQVLGKVPVKDVLFDSTKRKMLDPTFVTNFLC